MGDDVQLDYEIKYDKNLDHTIKYFKIRHGTYLEEEKLFDYFGRKRMEGSMLHDRIDKSNKTDNNDKIDITGKNNGSNKNVKQAGNILKSYDDLWIDTQSKLVQIMELNPEMIREDGKIVKKNYKKCKIYGVTGISVKELIQVYPLIFGSRIPFAFLGFISPAQAVKKLLYKLCRRRTDFKLVYV